jgi:PAS domain S-box-containing protein
MIFSGEFPDAFEEGSGLTLFKIASEYVVMAMVTLAIFLIYRERALFGRTTYRLLVAANLLTLAAGMMFTLYTDVYGILNVMGHVTILTSFILIFFAIVRTGIVHPHELIFRSLKRSEESLRVEKDFAEAIVQNAQAIIMVVNKEGGTVLVNLFLEQVSGHRGANLVGRNWIDTLIPSEDQKRGAAVLGAVLTDQGTGNFVSNMLTKDGSKREIDWRLKWLDGGQGRPNGVLFIGHDMIDKRMLEREVEHRV